MTLVPGERKVAGIVGKGIQYLPGHRELFVDFVIENYAASCNKILDLGGGGFRFAFPLALTNKEVSVVDMDPVALDADLIKQHIKEKNPIFEKLDTSLIDCHQSDAVTFLENSEEKWDFISAFRLLHFFTPELFRSFFALASKKVAHNGFLVVSGISPYETDNATNFNDIYLLTSSLSADGLYRQFKEEEPAQLIRSQQNLQKHVHLFTKDLITELANKNGFAVIESDIASTRIIFGYVLKKL